MNQCISESVHKCISEDFIFNGGKGRDIRRDENKDT